MRFNGTLSTWNDERGFGYIEPTRGGEPVFVHVSAWPKGKGRPQVNQAVSFELEQGPKGKRAGKVQLQTVRPVRPVRQGPRRGERPGSAPGSRATRLAIPVFLLVCAMVAWWWRPPMWVWAWYGMASLVTCIAYAMDKSAAVNGGWRIRESRLHLLALVGGWPGALLAQQVLRHKSSKRGFRGVFWGTVVVNGVGLVVLVSPWGERVVGGI